MTPEPEYIRANYQVDITSPPTRGTTRGKGVEDTCMHTNAHALDTSGLTTS
jgi:hypothetical protein